MDEENSDSNSNPGDEESLSTPDVGQEIEVILRSMVSETSDNEEIFLVSSSEDDDNSSTSNSEIDEERIFELSTKISLIESLMDSMGPSTPTKLTDQLSSKEVVEEPSPSTSGLQKANTQLTSSNFPPSPPLSASPVEKDESVVSLIHKQFKDYLKNQELKPISSRMEFSENRPSSSETPSRHPMTESFSSASHERFSLNPPSHKTISSQRQPDLQVPPSSAHKQSQQCHSASISSSPSTSHQPLSTTKSSSPCSSSRIAAISSFISSPASNTTQSFGTILSALSDASTEKFLGSATSREQTKRSHEEDTSRDPSHGSSKHESLRTSNPFLNLSAPWVSHLHKNYSPQDLGPRNTLSTIPEEESESSFSMLKQLIQSSPCNLDETDRPEAKVRRKGGPYKNPHLLKGKSGKKNIYKNS